MKDLLSCSISSAALCAALSVNIAINIVTVIVSGVNFAIADGVIIIIIIKNVPLPVILTLF